MLEISTLFNFRKVVIYFHTSTIYESPYKHSNSLTEIPKIVLDFFPVRPPYVEKSDDFMKIEGNGDAGTVPIYHRIENTILPHPVQSLG